MCSHKNKAEPMRLRPLIRLVLWILFGCANRKRTLLTSYRRLNNRNFRRAWTIRGLIQHQHGVVPAKVGGVLDLATMTHQVLALVTLLPGCSAKLATDHALAID